MADKRYSPKIRNNAVINQTGEKTLIILFLYHEKKLSLTLKRQYPETPKNIISPNKPPLAIISTG